MSTVEEAFGAALYTDEVAALDAAASLLAADPAADAELSRRGVEFVRRAWERGWQPADVARLARRDLEEPHLRLLGALIEAETAGYERLPDRWAAQIAALDTRAWRADRFSYATAVLELYRLLVRLPSLDPVGPVPGDAPLPPRRWANRGC